MIDYDNREERKVLREALAKYFPLDSVTIIRQKAFGTSYDKTLVSAKEYFDTLNCGYSDITLFLHGKYDWSLCIVIDPVFKTVKFANIYNGTTRRIITIEHCSFWFDLLDPIDMIEHLFIRHRYEYRLAKRLFKLAKAARIRSRKNNMAEKVKALKEELL